MSDDIVVLASRAYPDADENGQALVQQIALDAFLDALEDSLRRRVREAEPADISAALRKALLLKALDQSENRRHNVPSLSPRTQQPNVASAMASSVVQTPALDRLDRVVDRFKQLTINFQQVLEAFSSQKTRTSRIPGSSVECFRCGRRGQI